jgi:hypothetical protein
MTRINWKAVARWLAYSVAFVSLGAIAAQMTGLFAVLAFFAGVALSRIEAKGDVNRAKDAKIAELEAMLEDILDAAEKEGKI